MAPPRHYLAWAEGEGLNPYHPLAWPPDGQARYRAWQLGRFRAHWKWLISQGYPALVREQSGRDALIWKVREQLEVALRPPPTRPYRVCPCHQLRGGLPPMRAKDEPWRDPFIYDGPLGVRCVAWLQTTQGRG